MDISTHFQAFKELNPGLKGQVAVDSKLSAIRLKKHLDYFGQLTSNVVISPPGIREDSNAADESDIPEVQQWWQANVGTNKHYEDQVIENFSHDGDPDLLIVVAKLLTGFDEPRNTILYIDRDLKQHNLIQAIARVNRLREGKTHGLLVDYRGILEELDTSIQKYQDLAKRTQGGYNIEDLEGLYRQVSTEYKKLPSLHNKLFALFPNVTNSGDDEQYREQMRAYLIPRYELDENGDEYDAHKKARDDFYQALTEFGLCLKTALSSRGFFEDPTVTQQHIDTYKQSLKFFTSLRQDAKLAAQETVDYSSYEQQIRRLVDKQVIGREVKEPQARYEVNRLGQQEKPENWSKEKLRNETDIIKTRIKHSIEQDLGDDPYAQKVFSELLKQAIAEGRGFV